MASGAIVSDFFEKHWTQIHPQYLSGLSHAFFPKTFLEIHRILYSYPPKGNSDKYIQRRETSRYISSAVHRPRGGYLLNPVLFCFSIYQISWIKTKKVTWLSRYFNLFTIYKHFGDFVKCIFTILLQIQHENKFLAASKHRQTKVRRFLGICLSDYFIYRSNRSWNETPSLLRSQNSE